MAGTTKVSGADLGLLQFAQDPSEVLERLGRSAGKAADATDKMGRANEKAATDASKEQDRAHERVETQHRVSLEGTAAGAARALGQAGAGGMDALFGGIRSMQAALPALGATIGGAQSGPVGAAAGTVAGTLAAAGLERTFGPAAQSREQAIQATIEAFAPAAAQGVEITKEEYLEVFTQALLIAGRQRDNEKGARSAAGFP